MLEVEGLRAGYGGAQALFGLDFRVRAGEVVALLGRNGMGKTTAVRSVMGLLSSVGGRLLGGRIAVDGAPVAGSNTKTDSRDLPAQMMVRPSTSAATCRGRI